MKGALFLLVFILAGAVSCRESKVPEFPPGPLGVKLDLSGTRAELGARILLRIRTRSEKGMVLDYPDVKGVVEKKNEDTIVKKITTRKYVLEDGSYAEESEYEIRCFKLGKVEIPSLEIKGRKGKKELIKKTRPYTIRIESSLEGKGRDIEEPEKPLKVPGEFPWSALVFLFLLLIGAAVAVFYWRKRRKKAKPGPQPLPPHVEALEALARIRKMPRETPRQIEEVVVETSYVVRKYIEKRFGIHAPERTTEEFLSEVSSSGIFSSWEKDLLSSFLFECDKAKFAAWTPPPEKQDALIDSAEEFVKKTAVEGGEGR